ncbi:GntR family transcriptional regulator [Paraburkholderia jirisanensis]
MFSMTPHPSLPLYVQVEETLAQRIQEGVWAVGDQLPSEEQLIEEFSVSRTTVRTTIQNLLQRGLVEIRRGKGTFVARPKIAQALTGLTGFVEDMEALGMKATARVLGKSIVPAPADVARKLGVPLGAEVVAIRRVRLADGMPLSYDETYLPVDLGRKIVADDLAIKPIFTLLENEYDTPLSEAEYRLEAVAADKMVAAALKIAVGSPLFLIERTSYSTSRRAVDYEKLYYRGDKIQFVTRLTRPATHAKRKVGRAA